MGHFPIFIAWFLLAALRWREDESNLLYNDNQAMTEKAILVL